MLQGVPHLPLAGPLYSINCDGWPHSPPPVIELSHSLREFAQHAGHSVEPAIAPGITPMATTMERDAGDPQWVRQQAQQRHAATPGQNDQQDQRPDESPAPDAACFPQKMTLRRCSVQSGTFGIGVAGALHRAATIAPDATSGRHAPSSPQRSARRSSPVAAAGHTIPVLRPRSATRRSRSLAVTLRCASVRPRHRHAPHRPACSTPYRTGDYRANAWETVRGDGRTRRPVADPAAALAGLPGTNRRRPGNLHQ